MITKKPAYAISDGRAFASLAEAQLEELTLIVGQWAPFEAGTVMTNRYIATQILSTRDKILDVLTTGPRSRAPKRKINASVVERQASESSSAAPRKRRTKAEMLALAASMRQEASLPLAEYPAQVQVPSELSTATP